MRFRCFLLVTGLALLLGPTVAMSQFGGQQGGFGGPPGGAGGFGGRGGFGAQQGALGGQQGGFGGQFGGGGRGFGAMDPNAMWDQLTGGKPIWRRAEITDPNLLQRFDRTAQRLGITNGQITKDQYVGMMQAMVQRFTQQGNTPGGGTMGAPGAGQPMAGGPNTGAMFAGAQPGGWGQPGGWNQPGGWGGRQRGNFGQGGGGGQGFSLNPEAIASFRFRQLDVNGDGLLNNDEVAADEVLHSEMQKWDTNGDRMIDLSEFTEYIRARIQQFQSGGQQGWNPLQMGEDDADKKPTVYRAGKLPPNIPPWFRQYDTDGDGQIGLWEWKAAGRAIPEFEAMDINGDGFVTVEEVMRTVVAKAGDGSSPGMGGFAMGPGGMGGFGGFGAFGGGRNRGMGGFGGFGGGQGMPGGFGGIGGGGRNRGMGGFGGFGGGQGIPGADQGGFGGGQGGGRRGGGGGGGRGRGQGGFGSGPPGGNG